MSRAPVWRAWIPCVAGVALAGAAGVFRFWPRPPLGVLDLARLPAYESALTASDTPLARAYRDQIARGPAALSAERASAERDRIPQDVTELYRKGPATAANAAVEWADVERILRGSPLNDRERRLLEDLPTDGRLTVKYERDLRALLRDRAAVVTLAHMAAGKPHCVFQHHWELGPAVRFEELPCLVAATQLVAARSLVLTTERRYREAVTELGAGLRIARQAATEPALVAYMTGAECEAIALRGMGAVLAAAGPNTAVAELARATVAANRQPLDLVYPLRGESAFFARTMEMVRRATPAQVASLQTILGGPDAPPVAAAPAHDYSDGTRAFLRNLVDAAEASTLHDIQTLIHDADRPLPDRIRSFRAAMADDLDQDNPVNRLRAMVSPSLARLEIAMPRAREEVTIAAAAVLAYRARAGRFPPSLAEACGRAPLDACTGGPLLYRADAGGFVVYSVGEDGSFSPDRPTALRAASAACFRYRTPGVRRAAGPTR